jgi:hypothetical protein
MRGLPAGACVVPSLGVQDRARIPQLARASRQSGRSSCGPAPPTSLQVFAAAYSFKAANSANPNKPRAGHSCGQRGMRCPDGAGVSCEGNVSALVDVTEASRVAVDPRWGHDRRRRMAARSRRRLGRLRRRRQPAIHLTAPARTGRQVDQHRQQRHPRQRGAADRRRRHPSTPSSDDSGNKETKTSSPGPRRGSSRQPSPSPSA